MELTVKKEIEETINITLPIFFKHPREQKYLGVLSEEQAISFSTTKGYSSYGNGDLWLFKSNIREAISSWNKISEGDFIEIHEDFLKLQSLLPVLIVHDSEN